MTRQDGKATIIPAYDKDGKHWTTQYIQENGEKRFAKDARKKDCRRLRHRRQPQRLGLPQLPPLIAATSKT
ncbi:hypothetical protein AXE65_12060 [Ventosimonas gracilis]|uniref:Uncharacterized protein n=1 Tax=Ventosimonas gracilis TaxID=1680762 RepID=A0A139SW79_9GAMM|nr:hypothetical protein [Ventosimonas gracilis]KXU38754.1 hypothetical protein AXE65_12060 [Ventosimonas gracilis]